MKIGTAWLYGLGLGAGLMYLYDPDRGRRRRSMLRDQMVGTLNDLDDAVGKSTRDLSNRTSGLIAEVQNRFSSEDVSDEVLEPRVRSSLGFAVSHPSAIRVTANQRRVTLSGPVLASEVDRLISVVSKVRGVQGVENQLEVHQKAGDVPGLKGPGKDRQQMRPELLQSNWTPGIRLLSVLMGGQLLLTGMTRGGLMSPLRTAIGLGLLARGLSNKELTRLFGLTDGRGAVNVRDTIEVNAPVEEVFHFWRDYENFSRFMSNVREIKDLGGGRSHWVVEGPAGSPVEWDARITELIPNDVIAWESVPESQIHNTGRVRFRPTPAGGTQVNIQMSYTPPAGIIGHMVAGVFGSSPRQAMTEDLARFKSLIEHGKTTAGGQTVTREQVVTAGQEGSAGQRQKDAESGLPGGGQGRQDQVGESGVYPASGPLPEGDAEVQGMASWGQGERGAEGYIDSGESELWGLKPEGGSEAEGSAQKDKEKKGKQKGE